MCLRSAWTPPAQGRPSHPRAGEKKQAKGYPHVACTELYTHVLLGGRSLRTSRQTFLHDLEPGVVAVHDRYQAYDSTRLGPLNHQSQPAAAVNP
jgi:transposase